MQTSENGYPKTSNNTNLAWLDKTDKEAFAKAAADSAAWKAANPQKAAEIERTIKAAFAK